MRLVNKIEIGIFKNDQTGFFETRRIFASYLLAFWLFFVLRQAVLLLKHDRKGMANMVYRSGFLLVLSCETESVESVE